MSDHPIPTICFPTVPLINHRHILSLSGFEKLSLPYHFQCTFLAPTLYPTEKLLGQPALLILQNASTLQRTISGIIITSRTRQTHHSTPKQTYSVTLAPRMALLKNNITPRVFVDQSPIDIAQQLLTQQAGYPPPAIRLQLHHAHPKQTMLMQVPNETDFAFLQRILAQIGVYYWFETQHQQEYLILCDHAPTDHTPKTFTYSAANLTNNPYTLFHPSVHYRHTTTHTVRATTANPAIACGKLYPLESNQCDTFESGLAQLFQIQHRFHAEQPYQNQCWFTPIQQPFTPPHIKTPPTPFTFPAYIDSSFTHANLDQQGNYRLRFLFDQNHHTKNQASPPVPALHPYAGQPHSQLHTGCHFPLQDGVAVLVGSLEDNHNRPVILGRIPNARTPSPVNQTSAKHNTVMTQAGHTLMLNDLPHTSHVSLHTFGKENQLLMQDHPNHQTVSLTSTQGDIALHAAQHVVKQTNANCLHTAGQDYTITAQHQLTLNTIGHLHTQAKQDATFTAGSTLSMHSTSGNINSHSANNISATSNAITWHTKTLPIAAKMVSIRAVAIHITSAETMQLGTTHAGIVLTPSGQITLFGPAVGGNIQYATPPKPLLSPVPHPPGSFTALGALSSIPSLHTPFDPHVDHLHWDKTTIDLHQNIHACFTAHGFQPGTALQVHIYAQQLHQPPQHLRTIPITISTQQPLVSLKVLWAPATDLKKATSTPHNTFRTTDITHRSLALTKYYFDMTWGNHQSDTTSQHLIIQTTLTLTAQYTDNLPVPANTPVTVLDATHRSQTMTLKKATEQGFQGVALGEVQLLLQHIEVLNQNHSMPYYAGILTLHANTPSPFRIMCLPPLMQYNIRTLKNQDTEKDLLHHAALQHIQQQGNHVVLFIHGYNVSPGKLGFYFTDFETLPSGATHFFAAKQSASIYRDIAFLNKRFSNPNHCPGLLSDITDATLNGDGAFNWFLHIEHYLNLAANRGHIDYAKLTRLLHVSWSGDPGMLNYMQAEFDAHRAAHHLTKLVQHLKQKGVTTIHIIAHSLGCGLLLAAMNQLGQRHPHQLIDHVFLWQAAVPNNVLATYGLTQPLSQWTKSDDAYLKQLQTQHLWCLPFAHKAAKKITVLYSHNDNILGPIPSTQPNPSMTQSDINQHKPNSELIMAYLFSKITHLQSAYALSTWIGRPPMYFLDANNRRDFYHHWIKLHPLDRTGHSFPKNLWSNLQQRDPQQIEASEAALKQAQALTLGATMPAILSVQLFNRLLTQQTIRELIAIIHTVEQTPYQPKPALGYAGLDQTSPEIVRWIQSGKLEQVDQTQWLFSHSGMKVPSTKILQHVYHDVILNGITPFGKYA